jgi:hypothetical protein
VFVGVCVEFVAAVAWLAELFPDPKQRERDAGQLQRPHIAALFGPELRRTTLLTTLVFAASYGIAFGAIQQLPQILGAQRVGTPSEAGHAAILATAKAAVGSAAAAASAAGQPELPAGKKRQIAGNASDEAVARVTLWQEVGGLIGRLLLALLAVHIVSRRTLLRVFQVPALVFVPLLFLWISRSLDQADTLLWIKIGVFFAGLFTIAQFSFWGNYIPLVFPLHLRGTGESFAANIGGRVLGTAAAWITITLSAATPPSPARIAVAAAVVACGYTLIGAILTRWLPEPEPEPLSD